MKIQWNQLICVTFHHGPLPELKLRSLPLWLHDSRVYWSGESISCHVSSVCWSGETIGCMTLREKWCNSLFFNTSLRPSSETFTSHSLQILVLYPSISAIIVSIPKIRLKKGGADHFLFTFCLKVCNSRLVIVNFQGAVISHVVKLWWRQRRKRVLS